MRSGLKLGRRDYIESWVLAQCSYLLSVTAELNQFLVHNFGSDVRCQGLCSRSSSLRHRCSESSGHCPKMIGVRADVIVVVVVQAELPHELPRVHIGVALRVKPFRPNYAISCGAILGYW